MVAASREDVIRELLDWLIEQLGESVDPGTRFTDLGTLDSFDILEFIVFAEKRFAVSFSAEDMADPAFASVEGMAAAIYARFAG